MRTIRGWLWRRLERRVNAAVDARLKPVLRRMDSLTLGGGEAGQVGEEARDASRARLELADRLADIERQLRESAATAKEARRLALEASRAIEQILQAEVEMWQAIDTAGGGDTGSGGTGRNGARAGVGK